MVGADGKCFEFTCLQILNQQNLKLPKNTKYHNNKCYLVYLVFLLTLELQKLTSKKLSFITQHKIKFLCPYTGHKKVVENIPAYM